MRPGNFKDTFLDDPDEYPESMRTAAEAEDEEHAYHDSFLEKREEGTHARKVTVLVLLAILLAGALGVAGFFVVHKGIRIPIPSLPGLNKAEESVSEAESSADAVSQDASGQETPQQAGDDGAGGAEENNAPGQTAGATETDVPQPELTGPDPSRIEQIVRERSGADSAAVYIYDLVRNKEYAAGNALERMYASATISVPILYTAASLLDSGAVTLNDSIMYVNSVGGRGEPGAEGRDGQSYPLSYYLTTMLTYSDNNCMNCLIDHLTLNMINQTCRAAGFETVDLQRKIVAEVTDGSENYVSAADLGAMVKELYNGKFRTIGRDFMIRYFRVSQEDAVPTLLGTAEALKGAAGSGDPDFLFLNQSGKGDSRYSEAAVIAGKDYAYVISIMMNGENGFAYDEAVREISDYVFGVLSDSGAGAP
ncbi:MAG: class A beta-lactamase-related serine hydrolase [Lachnospiraceae bacterium]|nr:class A beta-lactamase-related serine hydrolase [Lachnospiraceae bacterium]